MSSFAQKNVQVLGASFDTEAENAAFAQKFEFDYPLLCDTDRRLGLAYGACDDAAAQYPARISYLIGPDGVVVKAYSSVKPAEHPDEVLRDVV